LKRILLTYADMIRLSAHLGYSSLDEFRKNECLKVEFKDYGSPSTRLPPTVTTISGWCLKRSRDEKPEDSANGKPLRCRFLTTDNICTIYPARPSPCRIWPYSIKTLDKEINAFYSPQNDVQCQGFLEKRNPKRQLLTQPALEIKRHLVEVEDTIKRGLYEERTEGVIFDFTTIVHETGPSEIRA
jgi:Fe-S-cluster containining protein